MPYGEGKAREVERLLDKFAKPIDVSIYSDESKDIPMLMLATEPIAVNSDDKTARFVQRRGGKVIVFT